MFHPGRRTPPDSLCAAPGSLVFRSAPPDGSDRTYLKGYDDTVYNANSPIKDTFYMGYFSNPTTSHSLAYHLSQYLAYLKLCIEEPKKLIQFI